MRARSLAALILSCLALGLAAAPAGAEEGRLPAPPDLPVRGVWMHPGLFGPVKADAVEKMRTVLDEYARAGINTLIMLVKNTSGHVYYASEIGVPDPAYGWDFFGTFLAEARKRGMEVHPWFCVFPESAILGQVRQHPEWLISSPKREMVAAVNPALPAVRAYEIGLMLEVVRKYDVGWVHLDYVRYPCEPAEPFFGFDAETLRLFKEDTGVDMATVKARDTGNPVWNVWLRWNTGRVTVFVRELKAALAGTGRKVRISAAVFPDAVNARVMIGQDWAAWGREGLVDMLNPMIYTNDARLFETLVREAVACGGSRTIVCPGIGIGTSHNQNTPGGMLEQMRLSRTLEAGGVVFFSASSLAPPFLEALKTRQ
ncbi:MAG TPA: family 10 glycosylhydrolase [Candidatus Aminicenantes bacterium]|nr:family 10 glycosylhydrolase [Candidatus Aminicenantes bacterium]HRY65225.1 family 10 glycosylhydrolase [Candidatus Aminicenantes bacterium]HRZ72307.1 family 10 glycosylhydrolase [Candidatus Aminicenantes bacterium]